MDRPLTRVCKKCNTEQPLDRFVKVKKCRFGRSYRCKKCDYRHNRRFCNGPAQRNYHIRTKYGIEPDVYDSLFASQGGVCAICKSSSPGQIRAKHLYIDHDHATGSIRGLLCHPCNAGLGKFRDNPSSLLAAIAYLERAS